MRYGYGVGVGRRAPRLRAVSANFRGGFFVVISRVMAMRDNPAGAPARGRWWLPFVLLVFFSSIVSGPAAVRSEVSRDEQTTRVVKVTTETRIYVENSRGKTIIVGRKDADEVKVRIDKVVRAGDDETADRWMEELRYAVETDGERVSVVTRHPESEGGRRSLWNIFRRIKDRAYIDYTIEVPASFAAKLSTTSGDVKVSWLEGEVKLFGSSSDVFLKGVGGRVFTELSSGRVEADDLGGELYVRMSSGGVAARNVAGLVSVRGTSGDAELENVGGDVDIELSTGDVVLGVCRKNVNVRTQGGDIRIEEAAGSIKAAAASGDIEATITPVGDRDYVFETSSGDIDVAFHAAPGYGFTLEVNTGSGAIEGDLDVQLDEISRKTLKGKAGQGSGRLRIETASGDIRIIQKGK